MSFIAAAVIGAGVSIIGGSIASRGAGKAADTQAAAADRAAQLQQEQFDRQIELQAPWRQAGERALGKLEAASEYTPFGMAQFQADPGYGFRFEQGQKALERSAAARGGLISGNTGGALQQFGQGLASQEYQNAFNRYQTERSARLNPLQSLAGIGQTSVNALGQAGQAYATNAGNAYGAAGQARASGYVGQANALNSALSSGTNMYMQGQMMNRMYPGNSAQASFSQTGLGGSGFGSGLAYGNQDLGQYL